MIKKPQTSINFKILTLFPEIFPGILDFSITGDALKNGLWTYEAINIRDYAFDARKTVDDTPYGGSAGMILKADVVAHAIEKNLSPKTKKIIYLSPRGKVFNQQLARKLAQEDEIMMLCARYEGLDQRVIDEFTTRLYIFFGENIKRSTLVTADLSAIKIYRGVSIYKVNGSQYWYVRVWDKERQKYIVKGTGETSAIAAREVAKDYALSLLKQDRTVEREFTFRDPLPVEMATCP